MTNSNDVLEIEGNKIKKVNYFKYLGSMIQEDGSTNLEIENRISQGRRAIGILNSLLWSNNIINKTKTMIYKSIVESILIYRAETWTLNGRQKNKLLATEMDFWRRSAKKSRREKVKNSVIRELMNVNKNVIEVIEERSLRWFGHIKRMEAERIPKAVSEWEPDGKRRRGRPIGTWMNGVKENLAKRGLKEEDTKDREK